LRGGAWVFQSRGAFPVNPSDSERIETGPLPTAAVFASCEYDFQSGRFSWTDRAEALFDKLVAYANDLGLLAEEIDTATGELLGNFPQAFSHIGLITAAWEIDKARGRVS